MKKYLLYNVIFLIGAVAGMWLCRSYHFRDEVEMIQRDTVVRYDTIRIESPVETKYITSTDTLLVQLTDTISVHDTVYLVLNKQIKEYRGKEYFVKVSGYEPSLDYIEVYPKRVVISKTETATLVKSNTLSFGIEASYCNTLSIPIYFEYERMLHKNFAITVGGFYDLRVRQYGVMVGTNVQIGW